MVLKIDSGTYEVQGPGGGGPGGGEGGRIGVPVQLYLNTPMRNALPHGSVLLPMQGLFWEGKVRKDKRYVEIYIDVIYYREKVTVVNKLNKRKTGTRNVQYKASAS